MAAINPHLPLSALNDVVRGHTSPDALYQINSASPSEMNRPRSGHRAGEAGGAPVFRRDASGGSPLAGSPKKRLFRLPEDLND